MHTRRSTAFLSCGFALIGVVVQLLILFAMGFVSARPDFLPHVATSLIGLFTSAGSLGYLSCGYFSRTSNQVRAILVGSLIGWAALWIQVLFGSSVEYFPHAHESGAFVDYVFKPTFWVIFLGSIPSWIIGGIFGNVAWCKLQPDLA